MDGWMNSCLEWGTWGTNWWRLEEGQLSRPVSLLTVSRWHPTMLAFSWVTTSPKVPKSPNPWLAGNLPCDPNGRGTDSPGGGRLGLATIGSGWPSGVAISAPDLGRSPFNNLVRTLNWVAIILLIWKKSKLIILWLPSYFTVLYGPFFTLDSTAKLFGMLNCRSILK